MAIRCLLCCLVASFLLGCQTFRSWQGGCPGTYSGVKYYREQVDFLPFDGKVFFTFDLPLTALLDTVALPVTYFLSPQQPEGGFAIGCKWAQKK